MKLEALLFDVDGTLAETEEVHREAFNEAFVQAGLDLQWSKPLYDELLDVTGGKERMHYHVKREGLSTSQFTPEVIAELHAQKTKIYVERILKGDIELRPGIEQLLMDARAADLRLAITTTTSRINIDRLLKATIGEHALAWFEVYSTGDRVTNKKPHPEIYTLAIQDLKLAPTACLAIEDAPQGLASAVAAGVKTIVTKSAYSENKEFKGALKVLSSNAPCPTLQDLQSWFEQAS